MARMGIDEVEVETSRATGQPVRIAATMAMQAGGWLGCQTRTHNPQVKRLREAIRSTPSRRHQHRGEPR